MLQKLTETSTEMITCNELHKQDFSIPALKCFRCLAAKLEYTTSTAYTGYDTPQSQLNKFMLHIKKNCNSIQMLWLSGKSTEPRTAVWPTLHCISLRPQRHRPMLNRFFSVCGMLTRGCRNRMSKSLEMRMRLKLNVKLFG